MRSTRSIRRVPGDAPVTGGVALPHHYTGKVRDLYEVDHDRMLIVASDRISVFDVVLPDAIPDKGRALTALSTFWFEQTAAVWPNHVVSSDPTDFPETAGPEVAGRTDTGTPALRAVSTASFISSSENVGRAPAAGPQR